MAMLPDSRRAAAANCCGKGVARSEWKSAHTGCRLFFFQTTTTMLGRARDGPCPPPWACTRGRSGAQVDENKQLGGGRWAGSDDAPVQHRAAVGCLPLADRG